MPIPFYAEFMKNHAENALCDTPYSTIGPVAGNDWYKLCVYSCKKQKTVRKYDVDLEKYAWLMWNRLPTLIKKTRIKNMVARAWQLLAEVARAWSKDNIASMSAALAYYTFFSLTPLLLILITIAGFFFGDDEARQAITHQFVELIGARGAEAVNALLRGANDPEGGKISFIVGAVTLFIGATTVFAELQHDIDTIWKLPKEKAAGNGLLNLLKIRLLSFALIVSVGFLLIMSLVVSAGISMLTTLWGDWMINMEILLQLINFIVSTAIITVLFALIFKILPSTTIAWSDVWWGALVTSLLFSVGKFAIGIYIGKSAIASSFGAAGAFVVLIVWIYYSAQIFLIGTEFTYVYACKYGSRRNLSSPDNSVASADSEI